MQEIVVVLDRSGSMEAVKDDAIGGFNAFLKQQQELPDADDRRLTLVQFDHEYDAVHENMPVKQVPPLTPLTYVPRGSTALFDAVARTIDEIGQRLNNLPHEKRPAKVTVGILTDGMENASRKFHKDQVKAKIDLQTSQYAWDFVFMAQNYEQFADGNSSGAKVYACGTMGIASNNSSNVVNYRAAFTSYLSSKVGTAV